MALMEALILLVSAYSRARHGRHDAKQDLVEDNVCYATKPTRLPAKGGTRRSLWSSQYCLKTRQKQGAIFSSIAVLGHFLGVAGLLI
jgi:hypothetical protein